MKSNSKIRFFYLVLILVFIALKSNSQVGGYTFSALSGSYTDISGTSAGINSDDVLSGLIPIGFTFNLDGVNYSQVKVSSNGWLTFNSSASSSTTTNDLDFCSSTIRPLLAPLWDDLQVNPTYGGNAEYITVGTAPDRIFIMEWTSVEWNYASSSGDISFQVLLYETSNIIEFIYYQDAGSISSCSASIGIAGAATGSGNFLSLNNTGTSPVASSTSETTTIASKPATGQLYRFAPATCPTPSSLSATSVQATQADLSWAENGSATMWDIELGTTGFTPSGTPTQSGITTNPYTYTGLSANTSYEFYVRSDCGAGDMSSWQGPYSFSTPCEAYTVPYFEGFESGYTDNTIVAGCLLQESVLGSANWKANSSQTTYNRTPRTGSFNATLIYSNDDWLYIPISLSAGMNYEVTLYARQDGATSTNADIEVKYGTSPNAGSMTGSIVGVTGIINGGYQKITGSFGVPSSGIYYVGILGSINGTPWYLSLDDISIISISCPYPSSLTAASIVANQANLGWTENGSAAMWDIELGTAGFTPSGTPTQSGITSNPFTYTGLNANTSYEFYVRSDCGGGDFSAWVGPYVFTTSCSNLIPLTLPFIQDFESSAGTQTNSGTIICSTSNQWVLETDDIDGRVRFGSNAIQNNGGTGALTLDVAVSGMATNFAIMTIDLSAYSASSALELSFDFSHHGEESNVNDRVWIRGSSSDPWLEIYNWYANIGVAGTFVSAAGLDIDALLSANGQTPSATFQVKFGQQDDSNAATSTGSDGLTIDNVKIIEQVPMTYVSSTSTQASVDATFPGASNHEVIGIQIVTAGVLFPFDVTGINVNMNGTTSIADVSNIDVYYTGESSAFATSSHFGSVAPSTGTLTVSGSQTLTSGTNYFWIVYDISAAATINNFVDAQVVSIAMNGGVGSQVPSETDPAGEREILDIVTCDHTITLYDFSDDGWGTYWTGATFVDRTVDVLVDGVPVLVGLTLGSGSNGTSYSFSAEDGAAISTVVNYPTSEMKYVITGMNGDFVLDDGNNKTSPTGQSGIASCLFQHTFTVNGDAYYNGESAAKSNSTGDCITLSSDIKTQSGSAWYNYKIDLSNSFTISFDANFGTRTGVIDGTGGADGIVFSLQNECSNVGGTGSSIGYGGISPSIGIEIDTYGNASNNDPAGVGWLDHAAVFANGSNSHLSASELVSPYTWGQDYLKDGAYHSFTIDWDVSINTLTVFYGATQILSYTGDIVTAVFGGESQVYWGFTSGTGGCTNLHKIRMTQYPSVLASTQLQDATIALGESYSAEVQDNAASYSWSPNDGSISNQSIYNPIFTPTVTTTYCCDIMDDCGNTITDCFTITVDNLLPVELVDLKADCNGSDIVLSWRTLSEDHNEYFGVERSLDGSTFVELDRISGAGTSTAIQSYFFNDTQVPGSRLFYRLRQSDLNGNHSYSKVVQPSCVDLMYIDVFPNPFTEKLNIALYSDEGRPVGYKIIDCLGKCVLEGNLENGINSIDLSDNLLKGVYYVITWPENIKYSTKVIKY